MNGWGYDPERWRYNPPPPRPQLRQPGGQPLPWSYYQRVGNMIGVPENFWDWIGQGYPTMPNWQSRMQETRPMVNLETEAGVGGYYGGGDIFSRAPFRAGANYVWKHELGHHMDVKTGEDRFPIPAPFTLMSQRPEWEQAIERWRGDPQYPGGEGVWKYATGGHPIGSEEQPAWGEAYAHAATFPFARTPQYIQEFYPWRDWQEMEDTEKRRQVQLIAAGNVTRQAAEYSAARGIEPYATHRRLAEDELARMWEDYQNPEYPIASLAFAFAHDKVGSPEEARAAWDEIPEMDRHVALEWFFDELWPNVKSHPERFGRELGDWRNVKDFLDYIGIEGRGTIPGPMTNEQLNELYLNLRNQQRARRR